MKKLFLFSVLILMLLVVPTISAVKPVQVIDSGCEIRSPVAEYIKVGQNVQSNLHVLNLTVGANNNLVNGTSMCFFHLFNSSGHHIFKQNYSWDGEDWEFDIGGGNFSKAGVYAFYIQCSSSNSICAVSGAVEANSIGVELTQARSTLYVGLFAILIFLFVSGFVGIGLLPNKNTKDEEGKLLSISYLKYFRNVLWLFEWVLLMGLLYLGSNVAFAYMGGAELAAKIMFNIFRIMFVGLLVIVPVWMVWIFRTIAHDVVQNNLLKRGIFGSKL